MYRCEHCEAEREGYGYDDDNFHVNVVPKMKCAVCGKTAGDNYRALKTKYPDSYVI